MAALDQNSSIQGENKQPPSTAQPSSIIADGSGADISRALRKEFQSIIVKCVLQLTLIQTLSDILSSEAPVPIYPLINSQHLMILLECLERSYRFARIFNANMRLRVSLYKIGFMTQLPNLLRQETTSVNTLIFVLFRVVNDASVVAPSDASLAVDSDDSPLDVEANDPPPTALLGPTPYSLDRATVSSTSESKIIDICLSIFSSFNALDPAIKHRNIATWTPVVVRILRGIVQINDLKVGRVVTEWVLICGNDFSSAITFLDSIIPWLL